MATNQPRWSPTWHNLLAVAALLFFILAALAAHGTISGINWAVLACCGLACLAAEGIGF